MYNRYCPQPDGSYKRRIIRDPVPDAPIRENVEVPEIPPVAPQIDNAQKQPQRRERRYSSQEHPREKSVSSFLREILPRELDTSDLMIIILLLLISADEQKDQGNALLTLALYLFM